ncbi:uncharacterized protein [Antedon mediterranea]|uniref:uncharacterized protein n=1 Tax=Antedon mediterranea TaxID=105859 RepID=UPI003AF4868B
MEFIHYMLINYWLSEESETYIGLSHRLSNDGVYTWSNGSPLSYSAWYKSDGKENVVSNEPKPGNLEQCTLIKLETFHSLQQWKEVACEFPTTSQYICKYQLENAMWSNSTVGMHENSFQECHSNDFQCDNEECIHEIFVCDGTEDCKDGSDEMNCKDSCEQGGFLCKDGRCISVSFVCDFISHCRDLSDEIDCYHPNCSVGQYTCDNGQCIDMYMRCDLLIQCEDSSDEMECDVCSSGFQCYDGSCLPSRAVCDATNDCPGGIVEDEINCDYWGNNTCSKNEMTCKNNECSPKRYRCIFDPDEYHIQKGCRDVSHLEDCEHFECPKNTVKCPASYCIAERLRCNSVWECPNGEDEQDCVSYTCPGSYKCSHSEICVPRDDRCNGVKDCPEGDDEFFCGNECPNGCSCRGLEMECNGIAWNQTMASSISTSTRYLNLTGLRTVTPVTRRSNRKVTLKEAVLIDIELFALLVTADFSNDGIEELLPYTFGYQANMRSLILTNNDITHLPYGAFYGLNSLEILYINGNGLISIDSGVFLVISELQYLYIQKNELETYEEDVFDGLDKLKSFTSDDFLFCCFVGDIEHCDPAADQFSSCEDLMKNEVLRVLMWILGISALLGNTIVIIWRLYSKDYRNVQSILITNLAASDFLMGLYMIIIAGADLYYRGRYARFADDWKTSFLCSFAGSLSTLSSEFSVFILVVMSIDRAISVAFPFSTYRLNRKRCMNLLVVSWLIAIIISFLPMFNIPYFGDNYYGRPSVCLALPLTGDRLPGWEYAIAVFLAFNLFGFFIIAISYIYIYICVKRAAASVNKRQASSNELKMATKMAVIVFTDFCCWFPIILMGIVAQTGAWQIPVDIYVWSATLIMPINSSINPYLYTIPYIGEARRRRRMKRHGKSIHMNTESRSLDLTPLEKIRLDVERNRILPMLSVGTSRPYQLSAILDNHAKKVAANATKHHVFTEREVNQIENDLTKALLFLHRNKMLHGDVSEDYIIVYSESDGKRAFLIDTPTLSIDSTEEDTLRCQQELDQLKNVMNSLRVSKKHQNGL